MKQVLFVIIAVIIVNTSNAQLGKLKKLGKKVKNTTEKVKANSNTRNQSNDVSVNSTTGSSDLVDENLSTTIEKTVEEATIGTIKFSKSPIVIGQANQFTDEFTIHDNIYAIVELNGKISELGSGTDGGYFLLFDGGQNYHNINFAHNPADLENDYYLIDILPAPDKAIHSVDPVEFSKAFMIIPKGKHKIDITFSTGEELASGSFSIDMAGYDKQKIVANAKKASKNAENNYAKTVSLPAEFNQESQKFDDPALSQANMKKICKKSLSDCSQVLKIVVLGDGTSDDYHLFKNSLGVPLYKQTKPGVAILYKGSDGWCYFMKNIEFKREYTGGGKYAAPKLIEGIPVKIDCSKVD